jgi:UDP-N-acetyl-D-mannosaminuronate dehydrogenase
VTKRGIVLVAGLGEVGKPLLRILSRTFDCIGVDLDPVDVSSSCAVLHVCYPFQIPDFVGTTADYVYKYSPKLTVINSTVAPGTTRKVQEAVGDYAVAYSPVRGKHVRMEQDMLRYQKFVSAPRGEVLQLALEHFCQAGFQTASFPTPELAELTKLLETTYLGVLIAWAQEIERLAAGYGGTFDDVNVFFKEVDFLPSHTFPGKIGGHCVLPNIAILRSQLKSTLLDWVVESDQQKQRELVAV